MLPYKIIWAKEQMADESHFVPTRFIIISDTHGLDALQGLVGQSADVVIHCGDMTRGSELHEYEASIRLLKRINAPTKLVIAGNHDVTLDLPFYRKELAYLQHDEDIAMAKRKYGHLGEARKLFDQEAGIFLLDEGNHSFVLANGALLKVYASPYTPSVKVDEHVFQYHPVNGHDFAIDNADIVITHGPPKGVFDEVPCRKRVGCPDLFAAIERARPRIHCFGHVHEGWGAKLITWSDFSLGGSHQAKIKNGKSKLIENLSTVLANPAKRSEGFFGAFHCSNDPVPLQRGSQTLFVNAAVKGKGVLPVQPAWVVEIDLPSVSLNNSNTSASKRAMRQSRRIASLWEDTYLGSGIIEENEVRDVRGERSTESPGIIGVKS